MLEGLRQEILLPAPRVSSPPGDNRFFGCWQIGGAKDAFEDGDAATHDHVVGHVLHDGGGLPSHKGEQHRCLIEMLVFLVLFSCSHLVQVPEKEELSPACGGAANVTKKVAVVVPEDSVEA